MYISIYIYIYVFLPYWKQTNGMLWVDWRYSAPRMMVELPCTWQFRIITYKWWVCYWRHRGLFLELQSFRYPANDNTTDCCKTTHCWKLFIFWWFVALQTWSPLCRTYAEKPERYTIMISLHFAIPRECNLVFQPVVFKAPSLLTSPGWCRLQQGYDDVWGDPFALGHATWPCGRCSLVAGGKCRLGHLQALHNFVSLCRRKPSINR